MGDGTGIEWTDATWNPVRGCSRVSPGCENCYAERVAARFSAPGLPYEGLARLKVRRYDDGAGVEPIKREARWTGVVRLVAEHLADPLRWKRPRRIFVNSMSDLFHEKLTNEEIAAVFGVMAAAPHHTFQVLTKRAERMREWFRWATHHVQGPREICASAAMKLLREEGHRRAVGTMGSPTFDGAHRPWPLPNVWLGVSVEDQERADGRIPLLLDAPAAIRFISAEPLLERLFLSNYLHGRFDCTDCGQGVPADEDGCCAACGADCATHYGLDWVIAGAESGRGARPMEEDWVRSLRDQCAAARVAFFYKQNADAHGRKIKLPVVDGRQHVEWPG